MYTFLILSFFTYLWTSQFSQVVADQDYYFYTVQLSPLLGGLYARNPSWYDSDFHIPIFNSEVRNGFLILDVSQAPNWIAYWWTGRAYVRSGARYYVETRGKIEGNGGLCLVGRLKQLP